MGRPAKGALSTYSAEIRERIKSLRGENEGWGAISILVELELEGHAPQDLPSSGAVHRFLVEQGYIKYREPREPLTVKPPIKRSRYCHQKSLFDRINYRRKVLNENYPSRTMGKRAPLQVYPQAAHSKRVYSIRKEKQLLDMGRIYRFLGRGKWHRKVAQNKCVYLGRQHYYINHAVPGTMLTLKFSSRTKQLIFYDVNELEFARMNIKGISKEELMAGTTKELIQMHKKLYQSKKFPL